jgi:hypothetical protein
MGDPPGIKIWAGVCPPPTGPTIPAVAAVRAMGSETARRRRSGRRAPHTRAASDVRPERAPAVVRCAANPVRSRTRLECELRCDRKPTYRRTVLPKHLYLTGEAINDVKEKVNGYAV